MDKLKLLKITLLIVILAEEIKSVVKELVFFFNLKKCPSCSSITTKSANYCPKCRYKFN